MKINLPVTQHEYAFPTGREIVSVTDLKGRITYCNETFVEVSGFDEAELLGQSHNVVRHPDMPEEAFRDLWDTIQRGLPWTGVVKNRRKNGDHYWVRANVTPMRHGDRIVGYLSVRSEPSRAEVQACAALYARMVGEARQGTITLRLARGQLLPGTSLGRLAARVRAVWTALGGGSAVVMLLSMFAVAVVASWLSLGWALAAAALLGLGQSLWHQRRSKHALEQVTSDALRMAAGDLTQPPRTGSGGGLGLLELALNQMAVNLRTVVRDSRMEMERVSRAALEIASGNNDLAGRTEAHASSLAQTAAAMEEITGTVQQSADSALKGAELGDQTTAISEQSGASVKKLASSMEGIKTSSHRMGDLIQTIESVAFQTNILALNAAVEAARAGEQGRGFAVVASEVRALAQRAASAAKDIRQSIGDSIARVDAGNEQVGEASAQMAASLASVHQVNRMLDDISLKAKEQQLGINQVNEAVAHMDSMTQQNAALVQQLATLSKGLNAQVGAVTKTMRLFRLNPTDASMAELDAVELRRRAAPTKNHP